MADSMLFISWRDPARGQETRALEVFNEALAILGGRQQDGRIESFDVGLLDPNGAISGFIIVKGSQEQISELRSSDDFRRNVVASTLCVDGITHIEGACNEGVARDMAMYQEAIAQHA